MYQLSFSIELEMMSNRKSLTSMVNSLRLSDAYMRCRISPSLVQVMAIQLFGPESLSISTLTLG